jgi:hypothetical protein
MLAFEEVHLTCGIAPPESIEWERVAAKKRPGIIYFPARRVFLSSERPLLSGGLSALTFSSTAKSD